MNSIHPSLLSTRSNNALKHVQRSNRYSAPHLLFAASLVTASFDIFLNLDVYGISLRFSLLMQILFIVASLTVVGLAKSNNKKDIISPIAFKSLLCWTFFVTLWTPRTYDLAFSIGYSGWLFICIAVIFSAVQYYADDREASLKMLRMYINTYILISLFGLLQLMLGIVGVDLLVTQWWIAGRLPRLNGFSYEPSYYATYLVTGWGMLAWLVERRVSLYSRKYTKFGFAIVSLALVLSSSRMGILVVIGYAIYYVLKNLVFVFAKLRVDVGFVKLTISCGIAALVVIAVIAATVGFGSLTFLLFGTGLGGTADHSASIRLGQFHDTITLFKESPVIGYGLGGVWSYLAVKHSLPVDEVTGMNVTAEVLAATGLIGFPFFVMFICLLVFGSFKFLNKRSLESELLASAGVGFILLFMILQFNQSIIRIYLWNHVAIIALLYHHVSKGNSALSTARFSRREKSYRRSSGRA